MDYGVVPRVISNRKIPRKRDLRPLKTRRRPRALYDLHVNPDFRKSRLSSFLRRFSNNNLSTLKTLSQDVSRFLHKFYLTIYSTGPYRS